MHGKAANGGRHSGKPDSQGVPRPRLKCFATVLGVQRVTHPELGEMAQLLVEAGDLALEVSFPVEFAGQIGKELSALDTGVVLARADQLPKEPPK